MLGEVRCPGCGAVVPDTDSPTHAYMRSAPGCWGRYCSLTDWLAGLSDHDGVKTVQDLVDCYAVQHATNRDRRNRQSVAVHLMSLCAGLELALTGPQRRSGIGRWTHHDYPVLDPSPTDFPVTVIDVAAAPALTRSPAIERMTTLTWSAWAAHHATIRAWLAEAMT